MTTSKFRIPPVMIKKAVLRLVRNAGENADDLTPSEWMIRKLESIGTLSDDDRAALLGLQGSIRELRPYEDVVGKGTAPASSAQS